MEINQHTLRALREANGLSMSELARRTNGELSQSYISKIEAGKRQASPSAINTLAKALRVSRLALLRDPEGADAGVAA